MSWIHEIPDAAATGPLKAMYDAAIQRAGRVHNILRVMSLNPDALRDSMAMYRTLMFGPSGLSRALREFIAVVVSRANQCFY
ncbi:Carboxymuconolactone decarboxylase family protein [Phycisphaerae bacterium RAS2]|nr:Carboxymuconolactone decarboxylase family protein [Phycisphaerae bacterium RAS2]